MFLLGLLLHQVLSEDGGLPSALRALSEGAEAYQSQLTKDLEKFSQHVSMQLAGHAGV